MRTFPRYGWKRVMTLKKKKEREREWKGFDAAGLEDGRSGAQMKEYGQPIWATSGNLKI